MSNSVTISRSLLLASVMILTLLSCKKSNTKNYAGSFFKDQSVEAAIVESKIDSILLNHNLSNQAKDKEIERIKMNYRAKSRIQNIIIIATTAIIILLIVIFLIHNRYLLMKREKNRSIINSAQLQTKLYDQINEDLKSPITIIRGLVDILKQNIIDGNTSKNIINLDVIERQTHNISSLLNDALIFSHSKDKVLSKWVTGDIIPYLQYLINCFADEAEIRGVMLLFLNSHDSIFMGFCKERLKVAINNILSITIKSCVEGEKVLLNVQHIKKENLCVISISQKGNKNNSRKAIPDTFKDSIIEENTEHELYNFNNKITIIRQLVKDMEGAFYFQKNSSNEISYSIELPIKNDNKHDKYIQTEPNELNNKSSEHLIDTMQTSTSKDIDNISKDGLILIVEDNQFMSFYISSLLSTKYNVLVSQNGIEALKVMEKKIPDLIITDLLMPQMDGNQLTEIVKKTPSTNHIPVIMITVKEDDEYRIQSIRAGVDSFLIKPFIEEELMALVEHLLNSRRDLMTRMEQILIDKQNRNENKGEDEDVGFIQKVIEIIISEMSNSNLSPQMIADKMFVSPSHLNRKIKSITELSTTGYILNIRLNRAKKMLITTQKQIGEVALDCGFNDFAYFSRAFKKEFGVTPSHYQRMGVE